MNSLIAIEWLKVRKYKTFWVLVGLFIVLLPFWNYEIANGIIKMGGNGKEGINFLNTAYSFPMVWSNMGFWGSIFIPFMSILVIILTTNEYNFRTHRQNVIDGWSRLQFYHAKISMIIILSAACTVYLFILGAIFGGITSSGLSDIFVQIEQVFYFFLLSVNYLGFAFIISLIIKRSGLAIGLFILYSLIVENILKFFINHYTDTPYGNLLPLQTSDELLPFPLMKMVQNMMPHQVTISMTTYALVTVIWCAIYYFAGRRLLVRSNW